MSMRIAATTHSNWGSLTCKVWKSISVCSWFSEHSNCSRHVNIERTRKDNAVRIRWDIGEHIWVFSCETLVERWYNILQIELRNRCTISLHAVEMNEWVFTAILAVRIWFERKQRVVKSETRHEVASCCITYGLTLKAKTYDAIRCNSEVCFWASPWISTNSWTRINTISI